MFSVEFNRRSRKSEGFEDIKKFYLKVKITFNMAKGLNYYIEVDQENFKVIFWTFNYEVAYLKII